MGRLCLDDTACHLLVCLMNTLTTATPGHAFADLGFFVSFLVCTWSFYKAIRTDPGFVPRPTSDQETRMVSPREAKSVTS